MGIFVKLITPCTEIAQDVLPEENGEEDVSVILSLFFRFSLHYHLRNHLKEAERMWRTTLQSKMKIQR